MDSNKDMGLFDLEDHFAFYGAYHSNPINILVHMLFVWPIFYTALILLYFVPMNFGLLITVIYALYYVKLDKKAGTLAAILCFFCWFGASSIACRLGFSLSWKVVLPFQLFCWTGQFVGHGVFEKRAPALLDNLVQAFLMGPFFVILEALQSFCGYEPSPGFRVRVKAKIEDEKKKWQELKQKKTT